MGCATAVVAWWCLARVARWPFKFKKKARTNILKGDKSDKSDLGGVDKVDSSLCAFGVNVQLDLSFKNKAPVPNTVSYILRSSVAQNRVLRKPYTAHTPT